MISASSVPTRTDWDGIRIIAVGNQEPSVLKHLEISGAERGVTLYGSRAEVQNLTARYCQSGVSLQAASGTSLLNLNFAECDIAFSAENTWNCSVENLQVKDCTAGLRLAGNGNFSLRRFDVRGIKETAIAIADKQLPILRNGLIQTLQTGLTIGAGGGDFQYLTIDARNGIIVEGQEMPLIKNCIIVNRRTTGTGYGIEDRNPGTLIRSRRASTP